MMFALALLVTDNGQLSRREKVELDSQIARDQADLDAKSLAYSTCAVAAATRLAPAPDAADILATAALARCLPEEAAFRTAYVIRFRSNNEGELARLREQVRGIAISRIVELRSGK